MDAIASIKSWLLLTREQNEKKKLNLNCVDKSMNIHLSIVIPAYNEEYCIPL